MHKKLQVMRKKRLDENHAFHLTASVKKDIAKHHVHEYSTYSNTI